MPLSNLGITKGDFENNAFDDFARVVVRIAKTKTISNVTGSPTYSGTDQTNIYAIFTKRSKSYELAKEGFFEKGDAFLQIKQDQTLNKEDLIVVDSETYRVDEVLLRIPQGVSMFKSVRLFKVDG
jgi:hypothetical protein